MPSIPQSSIPELVTQLARILMDRQWTATTAESCTGGGVAYAFTELSGSSQWFESGFVTYSNRMKTAMLGVDPHVLDSNGAVSAEVVEQMAVGALNKSNANISVAISGVAGPEGGSLEKPVGTVWFAWAVNATNTTPHDGDNFKNLMKQNDHTSLLSCHCELHQLNGDRKSVREQAIAIAIKGLIEQLLKYALK